MIGFHGGGTVDPEQVFAGVFLQSGDIGGGFRLRPGVDGATGEGIRIATINFDFIYGFPLGASGWTFVAGGGPSVVHHAHSPRSTSGDTGVGLHSSSASATTTASSPRSVWAAAGPSS